VIERRRCSETGADGETLIKREREVDSLVAGKQVEILPGFC
jgi:hypothetical protein